MDVGDLIRLGNPSQDTLSAPFATLNGTPTDPTSVELRVLSPDGVTKHYGWPAPAADGLLTKESVGRFFYEVQIDQPGTWRFRLAGTGEVTAASESSIRVDRQRVP